jgi:hypothetical protein
MSLAGHISRIWSVFIPFLFGCFAIEAAEVSIDFEKEIRPLLREKCYSCHGPEKQKGDLRLDNRTHAMKGGVEGLAIVAGHRSESLLFMRVTSHDEDERMPAKGPPLTEAERELIGKWIDAGAAWVETEEDRLAAQDNRGDHWAWQPLAVTQDGGKPTVDDFITKSLNEAGIEPLPEADDRTLVRRLYFDLTGLPPVLTDVEQFTREAANGRDEAVAALVDRLLASPRYGERWARHWLDIAHYADTHGFERDMKRDHAWRYRDWVIRALNDDMPYNDFLRKQIAGDVLYPNDPDAVVATGFLAAGPWDFVGQVETPSPLLKKLARADDIDDMMTQVMTAACGVTINCARCHDHKLDPISQKEYYELSAVFAGAKRADRHTDEGMAKNIAEEKSRLEKAIAATEIQLKRLERVGLDLADIVGGGKGDGSGTLGFGLHAGTGKLQMTPLEYVSVVPNKIVAVDNEYIEGVFVPDGGAKEEVPYVLSGARISGIPRTSGKVWDAVRNGILNSQKNTKVGAIDYASAGQSLLGLHANAGITFRLTPMRQKWPKDELRFDTVIGHGAGDLAKDAVVDVRILIDGEVVFVMEGMKGQPGRLSLSIPLPKDATFLTLMATEGADGQISHDQVFFGNPTVRPLRTIESTPEENLVKQKLREEVAEWHKQLKSLPEPEKVYAIGSSDPPPVHVYIRGNPENEGEEVSPGSLGLIADLNAALGSRDSPEGQRRVALANWITDERNPLTARVIVNRLWHYHFGTGLVNTPGDLGRGGGLPSHPALLDWLANELLRENWSLKEIHRLICQSAAYRRASGPIPEAAAAQDAANRFLWRGPVRRLEAEAFRDAVLATSGALDLTMYGAGWQDFVYREEYAPVYQYQTRDEPALWRRGIYRFVVRTTPHPFLTTLDCANPANLTPSRNLTTTALQSLALLNNDFMAIQSARFAKRLEELGGDEEKKIRHAFHLAFLRQPTEGELAGAMDLAKNHGWETLCRMLLNANEFIFID